MIKVFFCDNGSLDQLRLTIERIEAEAASNVRALGEMAAAPRIFPQRIHINALTLRIYLDQEMLVLRWARWARAVVDTWQSTSDPGPWDAQAVLDAIAAEAATESAH
jgi:hypothetical protein